MPASTPREALDLALRTGTVLVSISLLSEMHDVLTRKDFSRYVGEEDVLRFMAVLMRETELVDVDVSLSVCRDPKDDKLLELAVCGTASHLITGDDDLLALHPFREICIVTPRSFLELGPSGHRT